MMMMYSTVQYRMYACCMSNHDVAAFVSPCMYVMRLLCDMILFPRTVLPY